MYPSTTIAVPKQEIKEAASLVFVKLAPNNGVQKEITFTRRITYNSSFSSKRMIFHRYLEHATNVKKKLSITSDAIDHGATEPLYFPLDLNFFLSNDGHQKIIPTLFHQISIEEVSVSISIEGVSIAFC